MPVGAASMPLAEAGTAPPYFWYPPSPQPHTGRPSSNCVKAIPSLLALSLAQLRRCPSLQPCAWHSGLQYRTPQPPSQANVCMASSLGPDRLVQAWLKHHSPSPQQQLADAKEAGGCRSLDEDAVGPDAAAADKEAGGCRSLDEDAVGPDAAAADKEASGSRGRSNERGSGIRTSACSTSQSA